MKLIISSNYLIFTIQNETKAQRGMIGLGGSGMPGATDLYCEVLYGHFLNIFFHLISI